METLLGGEFVGGETSWWPVTELLVPARDLVDLPPCWLKNILAVCRPTVDG